MAHLFAGLLGGSEKPDPNDSTEPRKEEKRVTGKIIKVDDSGWGFITSKDIKFTRIFFHWTSLRQDTLKFTELKVGQKVEFTPVEVQDKGYRAIKIKVLTDGQSGS